MVCAVVSQGASETNGCSAGICGRRVGTVDVPLFVMVVVVGVGVYMLCIVVCLLLCCGCCCGICGFIRYDLWLFSFLLWSKCRNLWLLC